MFLTEYFTSVRVPDSATCHLRTPSSTPTLIPLSPHPLSLTLLWSLPRGNLNPNSSCRGPSWWNYRERCYICLWATAHWMAQLLDKTKYQWCTETIRRKCKDGRQSTDMKGKMCVGMLGIDQPDREVPQLFSLSSLFDSLQAIWPSVFRFFQFCTFHMSTNLTGLKSTKRKNFTFSPGHTSINSSCRV